MIYPDIDVAITSSCRKQIILTINSFLRHFSYSGRFVFLVNIDVINGNERYLSEILDFLENFKALVCINHHPTGQAEAVNSVWERIKSPYYFHLEDDWLFLRKVNIDNLVTIFEHHDKIDHIRFSKEPIPKYCWLYHRFPTITSESLLTNIQCEIDGIDLVKTFTWSFNPSISRTSIVKSFPKIPLGLEESEVFICRIYEELFNNQGAYLYGRIGTSHISKDIGRPIHRRIIGRWRKRKQWR